MTYITKPQMDRTHTRVRVLFQYEYSYSSTKESNRSRTRVHYQSNRTHDYFSRLYFFHMNSCKQIYQTDKMSNILGKYLNTNTFNS